MHQESGLAIVKTIRCCDQNYVSDGRRGLFTHNVFSSSRVIVQYCMCKILATIRYIRIWDCQNKSESRYRQVLSALLQGIMRTLG
jgi:hypothetical protein